jgi:hypothetical protein
VLDETAAAVDRGLSDVALRTEIRTRFEAQRAEPGGVDVPLALPGFLEITVGAAERDVRAR